MKGLYTLFSLSLFCFINALLCDNCQAQSFDCQAHRGGRGLMPENTIEAMLDATDRRVTTLELDLHVSSDKEVIVSHDPFFNPVFTLSPEGNALQIDKKIALYGLTYDSIAKYDVGSKLNPDFPEKKNIPARVPRLITLISAVEDKARLVGKTIEYNIEIKSKAGTDGILHPVFDEYVQLVMDVILQLGITQKVTIQSFDIRVLQIMHQQYPSVRLSYLIGAKQFEEPSVLIHTLGFVPEVYSPHFSHIDEQLVSFCKEKKMKLIPWTVNDLDTMKRLKSLGVDGIITDYPNLFDELKGCFLE